MNAQIIFNDGNSVVFENFKKIEKILCQGFKEYFYQIYHSEKEVMEEYRVEKIKEIIIK